MLKSVFLVIVINFTTYFIYFTCKEGGILHEVIYKLIGRKITYYRKLRDMTQIQLARRIHISVSSLSKVERGSYNNNIPMSMLISIAEGLNIELSSLVTFNDEEKKFNSGN